MASGPFEGRCARGKVRSNLPADDPFALLGGGLPLNYPPSAGMKTLFPAGGK